MTSCARCARCAEHLSKVGVLLRAKRLLPDGKMKSFLEAHCPRVAVEGE